MNSILLPAHLTFAGIWPGCVITETLFERALLGNSREQELILAKLHKRVDLLEFSILDHKQHIYGAVVLASIVLALLIGVYILYIAQTLNT